MMLALASDIKATQIRQMRSLRMRERDTEYLKPGLLQQPGAIGGPMTLV